jgi:hypothetical protein
MGATYLLVCQLLSRDDVRGETTDRRKDALPNLTLETQIGLAQFGAFLTELSNLGTL